VDDSAIHAVVERSGRKAEAQIQERLKAERLFIVRLHNL
jgi:hypothetical protein